MAAPLRAGSGAAAARGAAALLRRGCSGGGGASESNISRIRHRARIAARMGAQRSLRCSLHAHSLAFT